MKTALQPRENISIIDATHNKKGGRLRVVTSKTSASATDGPLQPSAGDIYDRLTLKLTDAKALVFAITEISEHLHGSKQDVSRYTAAIGSLSRQALDMLEEVDQKADELSPFIQPG